MLPLNFSQTIFFLIFLFEREQTSKYSISYPSIISCTIHSAGLLPSVSIWRRHDDSSTAIDHSWRSDFFLFDQTIVKELLILIFYFRRSLSFSSRDMTKVSQDVSVYYFTESGINIQLLEHRLVCTICCPWYLLYPPTS